MALIGYLRPEEEDWQDVFDRLCERFANFPAQKVVDILRENNGHAGQAAAALRDLGGTGKRDVDPDDIEHVKTLLTSPVMFSHVCKENFRKFDTNGNGVLELKEVLHLVNALYDGFGLQPPREGNLRSFFEANDVNKDGVLSEKEFKTFFEMFLRYAFFDVTQKEHRRVDLASGPEPTAPEPQEEYRAPKHSPKHSRDRSEGGSKRERSDHRSRRQSGQEETRRPLGALQVVASNGITLRRTADREDRTDRMVANGEVVTILEQWVKTDKGWLPIFDGTGKPLVEPVPADYDPKRVHFANAQSAGQPSVQQQSGSRRERKQKSKSPDRSPPPPQPQGDTLQPGEEEWNDRFLRLQERFPTLSAGDVLRTLRSCNGHAGHTASALRELVVQC